MSLMLGRVTMFPALDNQPVAVTGDGGVRLKNPSPYGGMWAFRLTNAGNEPVAEACGAVTVDDVSPLTTVTNNFTEVLAILIGLESVPDGWSGLVRTDSLHAIRVFRENYDRYWLTEGVKLRIVTTLDRLGKLSFELLAGHPSKEQVALMESGVRCLKPGKPYPYCLHNHHLDSVLLPRAWSEHEDSLRGPNDRQD